MDERRLLHMSVDHMKVGAPIMKTTLAIIIVLALALIVGGIVLVYAGATGSTQLHLLGAKLDTQSVGAVGLVSGLLLGIFGIRRVLTTLERLGRM